MLDKSGWMYEVPKMDGKKTLGRRLSSRSKSKPKKYWYVNFDIVLDHFS